MYSLSILGAVSRDRSAALPHCADHALDRCAHQPGLVELDVVAAARRDDVLRARHEMRKLVLNGAPCPLEDGREVGRDPAGSSNGLTCESTTGSRRSGLAVWAWRIWAERASVS